MPDQDHQNQYNSGFYRDESGGLILVDRNGKTVKLDFDVDKLNLQKQTESTIKNNIENESDMNLEKPSQTDDMTPKQAEENYWLETEQTKLDGSTAMMEKRISAMMESTGKSREESSKEVKARMKKAGSDNTNTTDTSDVKDMDKDKDKDEEEEMDEDEYKKKDKKDTKDTIEICSKEFDMLKEKAERLDTIEAELETEKASKEELQNKMDTIESKVNTIFEEREKELEVKRIATIKKLSTDFDVPEEELKDKSIERLEEDMKLLDLAIKKNVEEEEIIEFDFDDVETDFGRRVKALDDAYKIKTVKV